MQTPQVGQQFGRYTLEAQIGAGGMGVVFAARDSHLNRVVALKVVAAQFAQNPEFRQRFQREADTLARLDSPHIVAIFDHGEVDGLPYLATQYVRGGDLGMALRARGALPSDLAVSVCAQIADALEEAHSAGVIHRDIKPSNVLLRDIDSTRLYPYLCDFGIAQDQTSDRLTTAGGVVGTWAYLAPERANGAPATRGSDIYSLGCLLWVCLTGSAPYSGTDVSVVMSHQNAPVRQLQPTDAHARHLNSVLARAMHKDPTKRYADAGELRAALESTPKATASVVPLALPGTIPPPADPTVAARRPAPAAPTQAPPRQPPPPAPPAYVAPTLTPRQPDRPLKRGRATTLLAVVGVLAIAAITSVLVWSPWQGEDIRTGGGSGGSSSTDPTDPTASGPSTSPGAPIDTSVRGDVDGDGDGDAYAYFQDHGGDYSVDANERYLLWNDKVTVAAPQKYNPDLVYGDFSGDGRSDRISLRLDPARQIVVDDESNTLRDETFKGVPSTDPPLYLLSTAGDFNGDGKLDLAFGIQEERKKIGVYVMLNEGYYGFEAPKLWASLPGQHIYYTHLFPGDFDGDGSADLLVQANTDPLTFEGKYPSYTGPEGLQLLSSTDASFSAGAMAVVDGLQDWIITVGDFRGAGQPMVAVFSFGSPTIDFYDYGTSLDPVPAWTIPVPPHNGYEATGNGTAVDTDGDGTDGLMFSVRSSENSYAGIFLSEDTFDGAPAAKVGTVPKCKKDECTFFFLPVY